MWRPMDSSSMEKTEPQKVVMEETSDSPTVVGEMGATESSTKEWKPSTHELLIMISLAIITFMISLDACIVATSLHVSNSLAFLGRYAWRYA
jgi:hypothetical protein